MSIKSTSKRVAEILPFFVDWSAWVAGEADQLGQAVSIATATWAADGGVTVLGSPAPSLSANIATVWVSGGVAGTTATLTCTATTNRGHTVVRSISIVVSA